ncbi:MAG: hypothetical protein JMN26_12910, partial [gamma proteobacterium endosymbiont of Lamellibrachia anaximandri]|nr:hypothetical protein [gamma proteobacterium endosymbiont of Lamellibrachia anaximandri]
LYLSTRTHWVTLTNFIPYWEFRGSEFSSAQGYPGYGYGGYPGYGYGGYPGYGYGGYPGYGYGGYPGYGYGGYPGYGYGGYPYAAPAPAAPAAAE